MAPLSRCKERPVSFNYDNDDDDDDCRLTAFFHDNRYQKDEPFWNFLKQR